MLNLFSLAGLMDVAPLGGSSSAVATILKIALLFAVPVIVIGLIRVEQALPVFFPLFVDRIPVEQCQQFVFVFGGVSFEHY